MVVLWAAAKAARPMVMMMVENFILVVNVIGR